MSNDVERFSCAFSPFLCLLQRNVCSNLLPDLQLSYSYDVIVRVLKIDSGCISFMYSMICKHLSPFSGLIFQYVMVLFDA